MIQFHNVSKTYKNGTKALQGVNLTIEDGEFVFIVGSSGAGKSTLMKMILMEETPTEGQIEVNGYNLGKLKRRDIPFFRRTLGAVSYTHLDVYKRQLHHRPAVYDPGQRQLYPEV